MKLSEELLWRGFINQTTFKDIKELDKPGIKFYFGVDPSRDSMTIGNFAAAMMVRHFIEHGHQAVLLVGGATGLIGDPDGKDEERQLQSLKQVDINKKAIAAEYKRVFAGQKFTLVDNYDWFKNIGYLDFLRDIGKQFSMTQLLQRDFVQSRIGKDGKGISYAEFSYSLIQGYDFLHLYRKFGVTLQICGADQWGNSLSGVELIRKLEGAQANVYSCPLVINKVTGKKFGKSEAGAIWLNPNKTSVFDFYQFWLKLEDAGVEDYLKIFTLLGQKQVEDVMSEFAKDPAQRLAQKTLAYEVTSLVHGKRAADSAKAATEDMFNGAAAIPELKLTSVDTVAEVLVMANLAKSRTESVRLISQGGIRVNRLKVESADHKLSQGDILQAGKHRFVRIA